MTALISLSYLSDDKLRLAKYLRATPHLSNSATVGGQR